MQKPTTRHAAILDLAKIRGGWVEELAARFDVTPQTIRKDLNDLCDQRLLTRIHGGAILPSGVENLDYEARRRIAARREGGDRPRGRGAHPGHRLALHQHRHHHRGGRAALIGHEGLMVITNNINVANLLRALSGIEVIVAGGVVRGPTAASSARRRSISSASSRSTTR